MAGTDPKPPRRKFNFRELRGAAKMSTVGLTLVISSLIGTGIGYWIDNTWRTSPWGVAGGFLFGTAAGFLDMFQTVMKANKDD